MNHGLYIFATGMFLITPVILLAFRAFCPKIMPQWFAFVLATVFGWLFVAMSVVFYYNYLADLVRAAGTNPPQELLDRLTGNGPKQIVALTLGWAYGLVYFYICWLVYRIFIFGKRLMPTIVLKT